MTLTDLYQKALGNQFFSPEEGLFLYQHAPTSELVYLANMLRKRLHPDNKVGWIIDRNVNITNVCISQCLFCNFCRKGKESDAYITSMEEYTHKIIDLQEKGGDQLLLQGGLHPKLGLDFYTQLFRQLKDRFPNLKLHALGPPEVFYLAKKDNLSYKEVLLRLVDSGLDSLPGAGAEILSDRVRKLLSPAKCTSQEWLDVMYEAHQINLPTSATMMFGHIETPEERIAHLIKLRDLQALKPKNNHGFITFIPWPFQGENTRLTRKFAKPAIISSEDYIRLIAISRILLPNIANIQASWLTVGKPVAQMSLHAGANDLGSIMIEENVVSAAGAHFSMNSDTIQKAIIEAGFIARRRNQKYEEYNSI
jgi:cyclic dehypoxanthinyl futalosine synthase